MKFFILFLIEVKCTKISSLCYMFAPGNIHEYMLWLAKVLTQRFKIYSSLCPVKSNGTPSVTSENTGYNST